MKEQDDDLLYLLERAAARMRPDAEAPAVPAEMELGSAALDARHHIHVTEREV